MIIRCLDISTCALTQHDVELLQKPFLWEKNPLYSYGYDLGAFITGPDFSEADPGILAEREREMREFGYSDSMLKLLAYCRAHDIQLIRVDADGDGELCDDGVLDYHEW